MMLALHEIGTGGALGSLLSGDPVSARSFTRDIVEPPHSHEIVDTVWHDDAGNLRVTIRFDGDIDESAVTRGVMRMRVNHETLDTPLEQTWQIRGSVADIQRRVGLNAVHALHGWLAKLEG